MKLTKQHLQQIINEEYEILLQEHAKDYIWGVKAPYGRAANQYMISILKKNLISESAPYSDESVFTFVDDPDDNSPWIIDPDTGEKWADYDPMGDQKTHWAEDGIHPEDAADAAHEEYLENLEVRGFEHPGTISSLKSYKYYRQEAHDYAQKYNLVDSNYIEPITKAEIDPSIKTFDTGGFGRFHGSDRTPWAGKVEQIKTLSPTSEMGAPVVVPQEPYEYLSPWELPVTESLKKFD